MNDCMGCSVFALMRTYLAIHFHRECYMEDGDVTHTINCIYEIETEWNFVIVCPHLFTKTRVAFVLL